MKYVIHSYRHGDAILRGEGYAPSYKKLLTMLEGITDEELCERQASYTPAPMSLSRALNDILKERLADLGWDPESPIFQESEYQGERWRLDFAKPPISLEVAFNHGEAIAWNLLKPVLASELNHVKKAIQTEVGIVICATAELKSACAFDGAVGEFEKFLRYLKPMSTVLTVPMVIVGLGAPTTFRMSRVKQGGRSISSIVRLDAKTKRR